MQHDAMQLDLVPAERRATRSQTIEQIARALGEGAARVGPCRLDSWLRGRKYAAFRLGGVLLVFRLGEGVRPELVSERGGKVRKVVALAWALLWMEQTTEARAAFVARVGEEA